MNELEKAWKEWKDSVSLTYPGNFGVYFLNNYTKGYKNYDIYHETNNDKAYTELMWAIASGELDGKILDN